MKKLFIFITILVFILSFNTNLYAYSTGTAPASVSLTITGTSWSASWTNTGDPHYYLMITTSSTFPGWSGGLSTNSPTTSFSGSGLTAGQTYYVYVTGVDAGWGWTTATRSNSAMSISALGNYLDFDGSNDHVDFSGTVSSLTDNFTYEAIVKHQTATGYGWIFRNGGSSIELGVFQNTFLVGVNNMTTNINFTFVPGTWYHVAVGKNAGTWFAYVNGVAQTFAGTPGMPSVPSGNMNIGGSFEAYKGGIDEVRIWNVVRSQAQIQANMGNELAGNESGLVGYWNFNQGNAAGNNSSLTTLKATTGGINGTLSGFALTGAASNFLGCCNYFTSQTITFNELSDQTYGAGNFDPGATATSGLTVTYSSSNNSVANIVSNQVHIVAPGTVTIYADQAGDGTYSAAPQLSQSFNVNKKELTVSGATATEKIYDGTTDASISGATLEGIVGSDDVALADETTGIFDTQNAGTDISVTTAMTLTGTAADNYSLTQPTLTANITAKTLTVNDAMAADKEYDGTSDASISGATLDGIVGSDDVALADETSGTFDSPNVGSDISVATAMTLTGAASDNYELTQPTITANINAKELIVTGAMAGEKIYDGTTNASISGAALVGIVGSDDVALAEDTIGTFVTANIGTDISVTTAMTLTGASADNYYLTQPVLTSNIGPKTLIVTDAKASDKVYDGTVDATISGSTLAGIVGSDDVSLVDETSGTFASATIGTDISVNTTMALTGAASDNYSLTQPTLTANITSKELTVSGAVAADKSYDGNTDATISGATLEGIVGSDDVSLVNDATGTFTSANSGTNISITTEMTLTGADAGNYTLVQPTLTATIIGITLTVSDAMAANKVYNATTTAVISGGTLIGVISPDVVSLSNATTGTFASANVGTGISVTPAMTLSGADAGKYMLTQPTLTANITKKDLSVTAADKTKIQGEVNPAFTLIYSGFEGSDGTSVINVLPTASCVADASSITGDYNIILAGGSDNNYNLILHNGKLTVDPATTILTAKAGEVSIYPNPASDYIIVNNLQDKMTIRIFNLLGKLVKTTIVSGTEKISVSDLSTGVYIIKLSGKGIETVTRFVKQ